MYSDVLYTAWQYLQLTSYRRRRLWEFCKNTRIGLVFFILLFFFSGLKYKVGLGSIMQCSVVVPQVEPLT